MCGIAGIITKGQRVNEIALKRAISCLQHRGPENEGLWLNKDGHTALGHRRLSIIDLTAAAAQPMQLSGRFTIVHNGEIYNYLELKKELQQKGCVFQSASDTEVILHAYQLWGKECLQKFDGMFAFAIWDEEEKKLFAARDRMGEKPFFYSLTQDGFQFASEMKALWNMGINKSVNHAMLFNFLTIGYTSNPTDPAETFYEGICQLPAASYLFYEPSSENIEVNQYWHIYLSDNHSIKEDEAIEQFDALITASIKMRLRTDVPSGTSLSGGLDSSSIVALCHEIPSDNYSHTCFTAGFPGYDKDETAFASTVAHHLGLKHHVLTIDEKEVPVLMQKVAAAQEVPFSSASPLIQYKVFETAKTNGITVLLDGQGADELLAGYGKYYRWYWQELYRRGSLASSRELQNARQLGVNENFGWKEKLSALIPHFAASLQQVRKTRKAFQLRELNKDFANSNKHSNYYTLPVHHSLNGILHHNSFVQGLDELLRLADRNSMANSLELRLPFLSHTLIEFLFSLPPEFKIRKGWTKWILRKSMVGRLPQQIVWRKEKIGFEPPQKKWMEIKEVRENIMEAKNLLYSKNVISISALKNYRPHNAYETGNMDWKYWSASTLFH